MAEFTKVAHEWVRMCKAYSDAGDCMKCPLVTNPICGCMSDDNGASDEEISKAESDIMSWAAENPEPVYPSWAEWLIEQGIYVGKFIKDKPRLGDLNVDLRITDKVYQPIDADMAQKLGIEPKEG